MSVTEDAMLQWQVFQSLGAILFLVSIVPTLALHQLFSLGSKHLSPSNTETGTAVDWNDILLVALSYRYLAHEHNERWDLDTSKHHPCESSIRLSKT